MYDIIIYKIHIKLSFEYTLYLMTNPGEDLGGGSMLPPTEKLKVYYTRFFFSELMKRYVIVNF